MTEEGPDERVLGLVLRDGKTGQPGFLIPLDEDYEAGALRRECVLWAAVATMLVMLLLAFVLRRAAGRGQPLDWLDGLGLIIPSLALGIFLGFVRWVFLRGSHVFITSRRLDFSRGGVRRGIRFDHAHPLTVTDCGKRWEVRGSGGKRLSVPKKMFPRLEQGVDAAQGILDETKQAEEADASSTSS